MHPSDFAAEYPGIVIKNADGHWSFVPRPLPPIIDLDWDLTNSLSRADRAISELSGLGKTIPNPHLIIGPVKRNEAVLSSRIEGTQTSLSELFLFELETYSKRDIKNELDAREVLNYVRALEFGMRRLSDIPISLRLFRELHSILMKGVRGEDKAPGEFRKVPAWIGPPGRKIENAHYVAPPPKEMMNCLHEFELFFHDVQIDLPPLVKIALAHYQFEAIHPFRDGNGRIGRLLITLMLCAYGVLSQPLLYLSAYFEKYRSEYYGLLLDVSKLGNWKEWFLFFFEGIVRQSEQASAMANRLIALLESYHARCMEVRSPALLIRLLDSLFNIPFTTNPRIAAELGISYPAASNLVKKLQKMDILREVSKQKRNRLFVAHEIIEAVTIE